MAPSIALLLSFSTAVPISASGASCFVPSSSRGAPIVGLPRTSTRLGLQGDYLLSLERSSKAGNDAPDGTRGTEASLKRSTGRDDPYAPGVAESYGLVDSTENDGFDAAADAVGPGIYGGSVQRDADGNILIGAQHENHNHKPGPLYDGTGYSLMARAIHAGPDKVVQLLHEYPQLIEEVGTGGARPLHVCGMSTQGQLCTQTLIDAGADIHAVDTYGYNALHRMASNDLELGAEALVQAGLDPNEELEGADSTPIEIARRQRAIKFLMAMQRLGHYE